MPRIITAALCLFAALAIFTATGRTEDTLPPDPHDAWRLANPWPTHPVEIASADAAPAEIVEVTGQYLTFPTRQGGTYHVRPLP